MSSARRDTSNNRIVQLPPLNRQFYLDRTATVAKNLLGKFLVVGKGAQCRIAEIVEVEAYLGTKDPASHAYRGKTKRNWPMFEFGGTCYVYLSYGINYCMNVSTGEEGFGQAVLFRAAAPIHGIESMYKNRQINPGADPNKESNLKKLMSGPGKLTHALGVDLSFNGKRFDCDDFKLVDPGVKLPSNSIARSPRIGISKAKEELLRYFVKTSPWLSRSRQPGGKT